MDKPADTDHPIEDVLARRWSPRAFVDRDVDEATVRSLLEAARWSPSSMNEQPWRFVVAARQDAAAFAALADCLVPSNRRWAQDAAVLVAVVAAERFRRNDKPNHHAWHDTGAAVAHLTVEATARGLVLHQMGGIDRDAVRATYDIPEAFSPVSVIAIGYPGIPDKLPDDLAERERAPRSRLPQAEIAFAGKWGEAL